jgi:hypothetical protein
MDEKGDDDEDEIEMMETTEAAENLDEDRGMAGTSQCQEQQKMQNYQEQQNMKT